MEEGEEDPPGMMDMMPLTVSRKESVWQRGEEEISKQG